jgi:hypothetical protein
MDLFRIMKRVDSLDLYTIISKVIFNITIKNYNFIWKVYIIVMIFKILLYFFYVFFFQNMVCVRSLNMFYNFFFSQFFIFLMD